MPLEQHAGLCLEALGMSGDILLENRKRNSIDGI